MKNLWLLLLIGFPLATSAQQTLTLKECYHLAETNYPLARQTSLLEDKTLVEIKSLEKGRLPKLDLNAQASYQSDVIEFPFRIPGSDVKTPNKDQYRATLDASQLIYNGGSIDANIRLKTAELETQQQQVAVDLYTLKSRINQNFFSVLLLQEQTNLLHSKMELLRARSKEIESGVKYGSLLSSSEQLLQAEMLKLEQQLSETDFDRKKSLDNLSALLFQNLDRNTVLARPQISVSQENYSNRPELRLFELQQNQLETSKEVISKSNYPRLSGFAQAGYGNPGLNMLDNSFQDFYRVGLMLNWNLFDWGKTKEKKQTVDISRAILYTEKETFQLNNEIEQKEVISDMEKFEEMLEKDNRIIKMREQVLQVTNSQLQNGAITYSEYITELDNLYEAKINQQLHEIQLVFMKANYRVIKGDFN